MIYLNSIIFVCLCLCVATVSTQSSCTVAQNCTRAVLNPLSSDQYVQCVLGECACEGENNCFTFNSTATYSRDSCVLDTRCYTYTSLGVCESTARDSMTALLLQIFAGGVGAANFYIGRTDLAGGQLFLFLALFTFSCCTFCVSCCIKPALSCGNKDTYLYGWLCAGVLFLVMLIILVLLLIILLINPIWWAADMIIFATNQRTDINGCRLNQP
ncbi:hypothetical protein LOD99_14418 [Oopsacas minuta]|uniref:Uncharacterized protein n=1 Tax=Oopsacas minuta TaxID=111878 RepID=A0AAV7KFE9_9METZ|nr:hypothetical protein LOD99_14418 [Oopsacas minuta]